MRGNSRETVEKKIVVQFPSTPTIYSGILFFLEKTVPAATLTKEKNVF